MNSASTSTASLLSKSQSSSSSLKNYKQAFGSLTSSFGFAGSVVSAPTPSSTRENKTLSQKQTSATSAEKCSSNSAPQQAQAAYWASQSQKNFEAAYGSLASTYGFGGSVPSPKPRKS